MKYKTFIRTTILLLLAALIMTAGIQIVLDPLFQYHTPLFGLKPVITDERYQNAGVANSMSQNFRISDVEDLFGGEVAKFTFSGSSFLDWSYILNIIKTRDKHLSNVLINIDPIVMEADSKKLTHELPLYLYDNNVFNDIDYLLSFDMIKRFSLDMLRENDFDYNDVYAWDTVYKCGRKIVLDKYTRPEKTTNLPDMDSYLSNLTENLDMFSLYFNEMTDTKFVFFFSPFSMLYWDEKKQCNELELQKRSYLLACDYLLSFSNVTVYLWTDDEMLNIMSDLDNYKDLTHYSGDISKLILKRIKGNTGVISKDNYKSEIDVLFNYITNYEYDLLFE